MITGSRNTAVILVSYKKKKNYLRIPRGNLYKREGGGMGRRKKNQNLRRKEARIYVQLVWYQQNCKGFRMFPPPDGHNILEHPKIQWF